MTVHVCVAEERPMCNLCIPRIFPQKTMLLNEEQVQKSVLESLYRSSFVDNMSTDNQKVVNISLPSM